MYVVLFVHSRMHTCMIKKLLKYAYRIHLRCMHARVRVYMYTPMYTCRLAYACMYVRSQICTPYPRIHACAHKNRQICADIHVLVRALDAHSLFVQAALAQREAGHCDTDHKGKHASKRRTYIHQSPSLVAALTLTCRLLLRLQAVQFWKADTTSSAWQTVLTVHWLRASAYGSTKAPRNKHAKK